MTDEQFVAIQEIKEKRQTATGAKHKKGGNSKKCNFPSDYLTKKEKDALNGAVFSWNPNKFYTWEEFVIFPDDIKVEYINSLISKYKVGIRSISRIVFDGEYRLYNHLYGKNLISKIQNVNSSGQSPRVNTEALAEAVYAYRNPEPIETPAPVIKTEVEEAKEKDISTTELRAEKTIDRLGKKLSKIRHMSFDMDDFDFEFLAYLATKFTGKDVTVHIQINVPQEMPY